MLTIMIVLLLPLTQPRQEPISDLLPRRRRHSPGFHCGYPIRDLLTSRRLRFRRGLQALYKGARDFGPFAVEQPERLLQ